MVSNGHCNARDIGRQLHITASNSECEADQPRNRCVVAPSSGGREILEAVADRLAPDRVVDVERGGLVLDLIDEMPEDQGGHPRVGTTEQVLAIVDQPMPDGEGHRFEPGRVCQVEAQGVRLEKVGV